MWWLSLLLSLLLSPEIIEVSAAAAAASCFQVQPKTNSFWGMAGTTLDAPDDYMQNMASEMLLLNAHYDHSYNKSPTETTSKTTTTFNNNNNNNNNNKMNMQKLVHAMERTRLHMKSMQEQAKHEASSIVSPWIKDDVMRDTATEWDTLGTNYDYSYNKSPTESKDNDDEPTSACKLIDEQQKSPADNDVVPMVKSWTRDHWEQWMSLHQIAERGEKSLAWPSTKEEKGEEGKNSADPSLQLPTQSWKTKEKDQQFQTYDNNNEGSQLWRSAVDPSSGETYYYHIHTKETQWNKPNPEQERFASASGHGGGPSYSSSYLESL